MSGRLAQARLCCVTNQQRGSLSKPFSFSSPFADHSSGCSTGWKMPSAWSWYLASRRAE